jgi:hypothetical protein
MFDEPNVETLANVLKGCLLDAQERDNENNPARVNLIREVK